ncbi:MAG: YjjG family noncanonical pyrimidine nucleotidase [Clostridium sp.]|nr:YjjG family noncanonical pyrimidine nucleotidase [Clostridium sp.]
MIKNILFDLDDTILDFKMSERVALSKTLIELDIEPTEYIISQYSKYNISQWKRLELGEISRDEVKINRYKLLFDDIGVDVSAKLATSIYEKNLAVGHYFIDGAEQMLHSLSKSYALHLVSNGTKAVQEGRLASAGISHYFENIFISEVIGFEKPSEKFFDFCFKKMINFNKNNTIIIGDSLTSDIKGGHNAGIKTVWFNPDHLSCTGSIAPDYEIHSLYEVENLITAL